MKLGTSQPGRSQEPLIDLSVVIPVYGSQGTLRPLTERLLAVLSNLSLEYEIIFVNDDSPDGAWTVLEELQREHPDTIMAVSLTRNFGQHNAVICGFHHSRGRYVLTMDDDLQHPPEEIPKLMDALESQHLDVVYGSYDEKAHAGWRNLGSTLLNVVFRKVFDTDVHFSSLRIIRREIVVAALVYDLNFTFIDGLLAWNTKRIGSVNVNHDLRQDGRSGYNLSKLVFLSLNLITNFSLYPLQAATLTGLAASTVGLGVGVFYLIRAMLGQVDVPGYASTITAIMFLGGIQLLALGIIGEYIGRMHLNVNRKPQYREREVLGGRSNQSTDSEAR